ATKEIQMRQLCHFFRADPDYGARIASKLGIDVEGMMSGAGSHAVEGTRNT
ncbi:MAG TPA: hypothetical protein DF699_05690, partial [Phycisphaerales bacterium]|nr:hypothetical protein [Phycisphaerales bacterium]